MCVVNNLKNIEMTASYRRNQENDLYQHPSSSDFASYEADSHSDDKAHSDSDSETQSLRPKPKIIKPEKRDESFDSNESLETEQEAPKAIRGRKKAAYVSPYRRSAPSPKKATPQTTKIPPKTNAAAKTYIGAAKPQTSAKTPNRNLPSTKASACTSPKKVTPSKSPIKIANKASTTAPPKPLPLVRQGTFTKEESSVPSKSLPVTDKKPNSSRPASSPTKAINTSPSRLPQFNRTRPQSNKTPTQPKQAKTWKRNSEPTMKNSASNHSLQSNDSGKTIVLARGSRPGSTSSVNSICSVKTKEVESKIANLWRKVEQTKKLPAKSDKRVWIESDKTETPKLIRSSTFEGQPKLSEINSNPKQKTAIGIRVSQIPSLRPKTAAKNTIPTVKKTTTARTVKKTSG